MIEARILDAAHGAIAAEGLQGVTLERIAQAAGLSRTTLHRRGIGKEDIVAALMLRVADSYRSEMWRVLTAPAPALERLERALHILCEQVEANLALLIGLRAGIDSYFREGDSNLRPVFIGPFERLLRDGMAEGSLPEQDAAETATVLFHLVGWTYLHLRESHNWPKTRALANTVNLALYGVLGRHDGKQCVLEKEVSHDHR